MCTVEYARAVTPQGLLGRHLSQLKIPVDIFTYHIVHLDESTQLLLTNVRVQGMTACNLAYIRNLKGDVLVYQDVVFEILSCRKHPAIDSRGRTMRVPKQMRWTVHDNGAEIISFTADIDSPLRYGHGQGYVGAYTLNGK